MEEESYSSLVVKSASTSSTTEETKLTETKGYSYEKCLKLQVDSFTSFTEQEILSSIILDTLTAEGGGLSCLWSSHNQRTRKRHRFIGFLLFPVYQPHKSKSKAMLSDVTFKLGPVAI